MIIDLPSTTVNTTSLHSQQFTLKLTAQTFKLLSSSTYRHKERAVLREVVANAYDTQKSVGNEHIPVRIHMPDELSPNLVISDCGAGMSANTLFSLYTEYFNSTKSLDNDSIGGFGIGAKSPFALSDTFTVTSIHDGLSNTLLAYQDNGIPTAMIIARDVPTDQPNGTTVSIPVSDESIIRTLRHELLSLFTYWEVQPKVDNYIYKLEKLPDSSTLHTKSYEYTDSYNYSSNQSKSIIKTLVVGNFAYELPDSLRNKLNSAIQADKTLDQKLTNYKKFLFDNARRNLEFTIKTPIGSIELSPSREVIEDTKTNLQYLFDKLSDIVDQLTTDIATMHPKILTFLTAYRDEVLTASTLAEAKNIYNRILLNTGINRETMRNYVNNARTSTDNKGEYLEYEQVIKNPEYTLLFNYEEIILSSRLNLTDGVEYSHVDCNNIGIYSTKTTTSRSAYFISRLNDNPTHTYYLTTQEGTTIARYLNVVTSLGYPKTFTEPVKSKDVSIYQVPTLDVDAVIAYLNLPNVKLYPTVSEDMVKNARKLLPKPAKATPTATGTKQSKQSPIIGNLVTSRNNVVTTAEITVEEFYKANYSSLYLIKNARTDWVDYEAVSWLRYAKTGVPDVTILALSNNGELNSKRWTTYMESANVITLNAKESIVPAATDPSLDLLVQAEALSALSMLPNNFNGYVSEYLPLLKRVVSPACYKLLESFESGVLGNYKRGYSLVYSGAKYLQKVNYSYYAVDMEHSLSKTLTLEEHLLLSSNYRLEAHIAIIDKFKLVPTYKSLIQRNLTKFKSEVLS
jgi:hypothetical protein